LINPTHFITLTQSDNLFYLGIHARKAYIKEKLKLILGGKHSQLKLKDTIDSYIHRQAI